MIPLKENTRKSKGKQSALQFDLVTGKRTYKMSYLHYDYPTLEGYGCLIYLKPYQSFQ